MRTDHEDLVPVYESLAERRIREAMDRGEFDEQPGTGRPIPDLDVWYESGWWVRRWVERHRHLDRLGEPAGLGEHERVRVRVPRLAAAAQARLADLERENDEIDARLSPVDRLIGRAASLCRPGEGS